jgi:hypothetical protein
MPFILSILTEAGSMVGPASRLVVLIVSISVSIPSSVAHGDGSQLGSAVVDQLLVHQIQILDHLVHPGRVLK